MAIFVYKGLTRNSEIENNLSEFCPTSRGWGELGIPNLAWMFLMKSCWILQIAWITAFTVSELLRENQHGVKLPRTQIRVNTYIINYGFQVNVTPWNL